MSKITGSAVENVFPIFCPIEVSLLENANTPKAGKTYTDGYGATKKKKSFKLLRLLA